ncbi:uncharacterized protein V1513DRAFT_440587 [Lipomyces chichibuensis]|uniref:uncharacterized protein n=1 Tax=Lipomyces chichibuensis TaxID=1546026 RepID=UPI003343CBB2
MIPHVITASGHTVSLLCDDQQQPTATNLTISTDAHQLSRIPAPTPPLSPSSRTISESAPPSLNHSYAATSYHKLPQSLPPIPPYSDQHLAQGQLELVAQSSSSFNESAYPHRRPPPPSQEHYASNYSYTAPDPQYNSNYTYASPSPAPVQSQQWYAPSQAPPPRQGQEQLGYNAMRSPPPADQRQYYQPSTAPYEHARSVSPLQPVNTPSGPSIPTPPSAATSPRRTSPRGSKSSPSPSPTTAAAGEPVRKTRRYTCHCGKSFTTSGHLARHMRIHTGEKNYVCPEKGCGARFSRQDNCMQHYRTHQSQGTKRNSVGLSANGGVRPVTTGVATAAIHAARKRRSSHTGVVDVRSSASRTAAQPATRTAVVKSETNREYKSLQHRHSVDYTPTSEFVHHQQSQSYHDPLAPPRLPPLQSPPLAPYQPQYSPHSQYSPLPPPATQLSQYNTVAPHQQQPPHLQYQSSPVPPTRAQQHYSPAPSSLPLPVMQTSPTTRVDVTSSASRLDELASIATQVAV